MTVPMAGIASLSLIPSNALAGGGGPQLTTTGQQVYVDDFTTGGALSNTYVVDGTSSNALTQNMIVASASSVQIKLSADGSSLVFGGYATPIGTPSEYSTPYLNRSIGIMNGSGVIDTTTQFQGSNGIPVTNALWLGGSNPVLGAAGKYSLTVGQYTNNPTVNITTPTPAVGNYFGNNLYFSATGPQANLGINEVSGGVVSHLPGFPTSFAAPNSPYSASDFVMADPDSSNPYGFDTIYVANTVAGLQKWTYNAGTYTNVWNYGSNSSSTSFAPDPTSTFLKSLAITTDGAGNNILYGIMVDTSVKGTGSATYDDTYLVKLTDPDISTTYGTDSYSVLAASAPGSEFGGVAFAPSGTAFGAGDLAVLQVGPAVPEPATLGILGLGAVGVLTRRRRVQV
jgi:hypothetical protein